MPNIETAMQNRKAGEKKAARRLLFSEAPEDQN
jgi:hypothetical protein